MKQTTLIIFLLILSIKGASQSITVDSFKDTAITFFDPINGKKLDITTKTIKEFTIQVINASGIEKIQQKNAAGNFFDISVSNSNSTGKLYKIVSPNIENNNEVILKLCKGNDTKTLVLKVTNGSDINTKENSCIPTPTYSITDCGQMKNFDNAFGENIESYDNKKIVYVYDFNKDPSKREFYRITRVKNSNKEKVSKLTVDLKSARSTKKSARKKFRKDKSDSTKRENLKNAITDFYEKKGAIEKEKRTYSPKIEVVNFNREKLTPGKNVKFKIYNINKFMYNVSVADSVVQFDSEPSPLFKQLFLGDSTLLKSLIGNFQNSIKAQGANLSKFDSLNDLIDCFVKKYNWIQNRALGAYDPCNTFPCCFYVEYADLANSLAIIRAKTAAIQSQLNDKKSLVTKCESAKTAVKDNNSKIIQYNTNIKSLNKTLDSLNIENKKLQDAIGKLKDDKADEKKKKQDESTAMLKVIDTKQTDLKSAQANLTKAQGDTVSLAKAQSAACNTDEKTAEQDLKDLTAMNDLLASLPTDKELKKIVVFLRNMVEQNNSYTSDYISLNGDLLDLTINITTKDSVIKYFSIPEYKNPPINIQIPIIRKPLVSFSSGSFVALGTYLQNKTYAWKETVGNNNVANSSQYTLVESGYTLPPMGFCALGNIEWRLCRSFGLGGSAGVGLSIEKNPRLAYLAGVSLLFGDSRQFTFTGGFVGMQVNKLTNNFQSIADNQIIYTSQPNIQYYQEFRIGAFISLTYTPFKIYKTKTIKANK